MIRCNLAILLAERNLKITKVSNDTGISRTTLTSLSNNYSQGIQFDTINTLCNYLKVTPDKLISYMPYDIKIENISIVNTEHQSNQYTDYPLDIKLGITKNNKLFICYIGGTCSVQYSPTGSIVDLQIDIKTLPDDNNDEQRSQNSLISSVFQSLSYAFFNDIEKKILFYIYEILGVSSEKSISYSLGFSDNLIPNI